MPGYLQLARVARLANDRIRAARELEDRWRALEPEQQDATRADWRAMKVALGAVGERVAAGPRGFVRAFGAAYRGEEAEAPAEPRSLGEIASELHRATEALRASLDAATAAPRPADEPRASGAQDAPEARGSGTQDRPTHEPRG